MAGRPKSYVREEAVVRARDAFWEHGYDALSVRLLEESVGISRFAIRTEFGSKEDLFLEALDSYYADAELYFIKPIRKGTVEALSAAISGLVEPYPGSPRVYGCLMVNTSVENARRENAAIEAKTKRHFDSIRRAVKKNIAASISAGQVPDELDAAECAEFIVGCVIAINTLNRQAGSIRGGRRFATSALRQIESWRA